MHVADFGSSYMLLQKPVRPSRRRFLCHPLPPYVFGHQRSPVLGDVLRFKFCVHVGHRTAACLVGSAISLRNREWEESEFPGSRVCGVESVHPHTSIHIKLSKWHHIQELLVPTVHSFPQGSAKGFSRDHHRGRRVGVNWYLAPPLDEMHT